MTLAGLVFFLVQAPATPGDLVVIRGGRVITLAGPEIEPGMVILEGGRIRHAGDPVAIPPEAKIVEAAGKVVMPGLVEAVGAFGQDPEANEEGREVTPEVRILDALDPRRRDLERARKSGITTLYVGPGNRNVIGGLGAVIKPAGRSRSEMVLREDAALKAAMGSAPIAGNFPPRSTTPTFFSRRPTTRMAVTWELRKAFLDARAGREGTGEEVLRRALGGQLGVRFSASRATDIESALAVAEEFGLSATLEEAQEAYALVGLLTRRNASVILRPGFSSAVGPESTEVRFNTFALLRAAGVRTAIACAGEPDGEALLLSAALAAKYGANRAEVLRAVTLTPAEILGVADRVGSLEPGKDGDLLILSGDPLGATTRIEQVYLRGKRVTPERKAE
jgi:imidazolonepropionase-like amidohydrolase